MATTARTFPDGSFVPIFVAEIRMTGDSRLTQVDVVVCPVGGSGKPLARPSELTAN